MSFSEQTSIGLTVETCDECAERFWVKPSAVQKVRASSFKKLLCRECQANRFLSVYPYPFCRRLTDEEIDELEYECFLMNRTEPREQTSRSVPIPPPKPMENPTHDLRAEVRRVLNLNDINYSAFAT